MVHDALSYPIDSPADGQSVQVAPGVLWIRLPLPYRLDHINVWALADGAGWTLVDTGARTEQTVAAWEALTARAPLDAPLTRVVVTHLHPDHIGMSGWLTRKYDVPLHITRQEYLTCRVLVADSHREAPPDALRFYREAGWSPAAIDGYRARFGNFGRHIHPLPDSYQRLCDGQVLRIGEHAWEVVTGAGHSPEHACLYSADLKLLISGDQVLPRISSNVSVQAMEPNANPMADWYASLEKVGARVPDDVLVLPAHHGCFHGLHVRLRQLRESQDAALERLLEVLAESRRAVDVFGALFRRPIEESDAAQYGMATGEALACLNHLLQEGRLRKEVRDGVAWYELAR